MSEADFSRTHWMRGDGGTSIAAILIWAVVWKESLRR